MDVKLHNADAWKAEPHFYNIYFSHEKALVNDASLSRSVALKPRLSVALLRCNFSKNISS